jgi:hypothetical protein
MITIVISKELAKYKNLRVNLVMPLISRLI